MEDTPLPVETAALVADLAGLPFSRRRYGRKRDEALLRATLGKHLYAQGLRATTGDPYRVDNVAGRAAALIFAQRDRTARGEVFERQHEAEFVEQALLEHETRDALTAKGLRGKKLDAAVRAAVEKAMDRVRGSYGRPSDEYPKAARFQVTPEATPLRVATPQEGADEEESALQEVQEHTGEPGKKYMVGSQ